MASPYYIANAPPLLSAVLQGVVATLLFLVLSSPVAQFASRCLATQLPWWMGSAVVQGITFLTLYVTIVFVWGQMSSEDAELE